jgi:hypothetical protein
VCVCKVSRPLNSPLLQLLVIVFDVVQWPHTWRVCDDVLCTAGALKGVACQLLALRLCPCPLVAGCCQHSSCTPVALFFAACAWYLLCSCSQQAGKQAKHMPHHPLPAVFFSCAACACRCWAALSEHLHLCMHGRIIELMHMLAAPL